MKWVSFNCLLFSDGSYLRKASDEKVLDPLSLSGTRKSFDSARVKVAKNLTQALDKRFEDKSQLLVASKIGILKYFPSKLEDDPGT